MDNKIIASILLAAILFVTVIAGAVVYYNGKISNLNSQISNLNGQVRNLTSPNLVTALGIKDIQYGLLYYLYIKGSLSNIGVGTAYNSVKSGGL
jgi:outer membrane murein-binding lipoprotein Lpp